jgi:hypothetical protein
MIISKMGHGMENIIGKIPINQPLSKGGNPIFSKDG